MNIATAAGENPGPLTASIDVQAALNGIPSFMAEIGGGGRLEKENIEVASRDPQYHEVFGDDPWRAKNSG